MNKLSEFIMAVKKHDKKNIKVIRNGDKNFLPDDKGTVTLNVNSGDSGNNNNNSGSNGVNYVPGLLYDGSLSGRKVQWIGSTSFGSTTTVTFNDDLGTKLNTVGDGLQFIPYMSKSLVTRGVSDSSTEIEMVYDKDNTAQDGKYVTTQYLPISINKEDLVTGNELVVSFDGIGEGDKSATENKAPEIHIKYNPGNNSIDISQVQGYSMDNLTDTKTGATYDVGISLINTFYIQDPVTQFPSTVQLFSGKAAGTIAISGTDSYYSNVSNGIEITLDNQVQSYANSLLYADFSPFNLSQTIKIPKEQLIIGNKVRFSIIGDGVVAKDDRSNLAESTSAKIRIGSRTDTNYLRGFENSFVEIDSNQIVFNLMVTVGLNLSSSWADDNYIVKIDKITPY